MLCMWTVSQGSSGAMRDHQLLSLCQAVGSTHMAYRSCVTAQQASPSSTS